MGYKPKRTLYKLTFEDADFEGLEVTAKSMSLASLADMMTLGEQLEGLDESKLSADDFRRFTDAMRLFARMLHSWNVEDDDGNPLPATYESLAGQEFGFAIEIMMQTINAVSKAPPPLPGASPSGVNAQEASIPMTPLRPSPSPGSSPAPS